MGGRVIRCGRRADGCCSLRSHRHRERPRVRNHARMSEERGGWVHWWWGVGDQARRVLQQGIAYRLGAIQQRQRIDFHRRSDLVALRDYERRGRFHQLLRRPIKLRTQIKHSPLKLVVLLVRRVHFRELATSGAGG